MIIFPNLPFRTWVSEILMMLTMGIFLFAALLTVNLNPSDNRYLKLFVTSFLTFVTMFIVAHVCLYLTHVSTYNLKWFELGPVFLFLLVGAVICGALTFLASGRR